MRFLAFVFRGVADGGGSGGAEGDGEKYLPVLVRVVGGETVEGEQSFEAASGAVQGLVGVCGFHDRHQARRVVVRGEWQGLGCAGEFGGGGGPGQGDLNGMARHGHPSPFLGELG
ncbi:hypothetical protein ACIBBB_25190 [Streptomyces sp. NPDC051217]|uniref:hypothetical protein n=1 Tax=Streptomyces sp. NPDC051217 TaxID=3365644 RepID=UPI0037A58503